MKWVSRGLWVAAWGAWVWCGCRLYKELPRQLGPPLCKLPLPTGESVLGFTGEDLVVSQSDALAQTTAYTVWDLATLQVLHHVRGPLSVYHHKSALQHGVVIGIPCRADAERPDSENQWHALDLRTGEWKSLGVEASLETPIYRVHAKHPWVALGVREGGRLVEVADVHTGRHIGTLAAPNASGRILDCCWLAGEELLVVRRASDSPGFIRLERWNVPLSVLVACVDVRQPADELIIPGEDDAIVLPGVGIKALHADQPFVILDPRTGDVCATGIEPYASDSGSGKRLLPSVLGSHLPYAAGAGRTVLAPDGSLRSVANPRVLWRPSRHETLYGDSAKGTFLVLESWGAVLWNRGPLAQVSWAVRDMESGTIRYRVAGSHPNLDHLSPSGLVGVDWEGVVYPMRPFINYPLLAVGQAILALPLVLTWLALRWRRKRRLRLAGVPA